MGFGSGLALQSTFPQQTFPRDYWRSSQGQKIGRQKAGEREQKENEKYLNSIRVQLGKGKVHPVYFEDMQANLADVLSAAEQAQLNAKVTGQNWRTDMNFQRKLSQAQANAQQLHALSQNQYTQEDQTVADLQAGTADEEMGMRFLELSRAGKKQELMQLQDPFGYVNTSRTPIGNYFSSSVQPYQKIDLPKLIHDDLTSEKNMTWIQTLAQNEGLPPNVRGSLSESGLPNTEQEAKILQKQIGYKETPTSVESIINAKVEDHYREMEKLVRADAMKLAQQAGDDYLKLDTEARKEYVKNAALARAIPQKGMKITEKMFKMPQPPRETQAEKDKQWQTEGNSYFNAKNKITVSNISDTDIPKILGMPALSQNPNIKVFTYSHKDVMENKPLIFYNQKGEPVEGTFKGVIADTKDFTGTGQIVMAVKEKQAYTDGSEKDILRFKTIPYNKANADVISNEYEVSPEQVLKALGGTGSLNVGGGVSSTRKSSGSSTSIKTISSQAEYDALSSGAQYYGPDGKLRTKK